MNLSCFYFSVHDDPVLLTFKRYLNVEELTLNEAFVKHELLRNEECTNLEIYHPVVGCCVNANFKSNPELNIKVYIPLYTWHNEPNLEDVWIKYLESLGIEILNNSAYIDAKKEYSEFLKKGESNWNDMCFKIR